MDADAMATELAAVFPSGILFELKQGNLTVWKNRSHDTVNVGALTGKFYAKDEVKRALRTFSKPYS